MIREGKEEGGEKRTRWAAEHWAWGFGHGGRATASSSLLLNAGGHQPPRMSAHPTSTPPLCVGTQRLPLTQRPSSTTPPPIQDLSLLPAVRKRVRLAVRLDAHERKHSKSCAEAAWRSQHAEELGIELSDEELSEEEAAATGRRGGRRGQALEAGDRGVDGVIAAQVCLLVVFYGGKGSNGDKGGGGGEQSWRDRRGPWLRKGGGGH